MPEVVITAEEEEINFGATGVNEIAQNVRMILITSAFSCPMFREFAWSPEIDAPINVAQARMSARIADSISIYEPRAQLISVEYNSDVINGVIKPVVKVNIDEVSL
ncbi:hypothetical protein EHS13_13810 [Paenibacillus psychroresistens]|uniref:IraD/Gp25-like domain-containing protein n=1 Tax=Paenibacillus psychroresistens TaxID=1778678 RepID=A0A6B8RJT3_9BACL|nr:hypothetical protein [Paenibacillus psychroresistens]QGQ95875.1 hypothetical protein EHS13_13810 [Paenibacillus psychroresistens]